MSPYSRLECDGILKKSRGLRLNVSNAPGTPRCSRSAVGLHGLFLTDDYCACGADVCLPDRSRRLDDDRDLQVDEVAVGVGAAALARVFASILYR